MLPRTRKLTIVAQDPGVLDEDDHILTTQIEIPAEELAPGPRGYRVHVVDYDASTDSFYIPQDYDDLDKPTNCYPDPFDGSLEPLTRETILNDPGFHAQNVYAIIMRTLARFEFALGRRVDWGFNGQQIYVAPHAFADANAFYSEADQTLAFGYFRVPGDDHSIFTCLSHDVIAHETTHALLDGLRERYTAPSSPEQAGFHEGFADIVAILSVFSLKDVVETILLKKSRRQKKKQDTIQVEGNLVPVTQINETALKNSVLLGLADEMGEKLTGIRGNALRRSIDLKPLSEAKLPRYLGSEEFYEPHKCGELLVAAMLNVFLRVWLRRLQKYLEGRKDVDVAVLVEEGADAANHLLTMAIRALDYLPPTDIKFQDYLSALLTADAEVVPDDSKYEYRQKLRDSFAEYGVKPASKDQKHGFWEVVSDEYIYDRTHFDSLMRDKTEVFRFIWDNRKALEIEEGAFSDKIYTKVQSVRPCIRVGPDGFTVRETVAEYIQMSTLFYKELDEHRLREDIEVFIPDDTEIKLYGGGTLIFDEYGRLKYHIRNNLFSRKHLPKRIEYLWRYGYISNTAFSENVFSRMHMNRLLSSRFDRTEGFE